MTQTDCLEKDGLSHPFLCPGRTVFRKEPGKAVRLCPGMDGQISCSCNICTSTIHGGRLKTAPCIFRTTHIHVGRIPQRARKAVRMFTGLVNEKCQLKLMASSCSPGFVYA